MSERTQWKHLSARTKALLAGAEAGANMSDQPDQSDHGVPDHGMPDKGVLVVVEEAEQVSAALLSALANAWGGTVLVGVLEEPDADGDRVVGCDIDADARGRVLLAAAGCVPPVPMTIYVENTERYPILRLEVESTGLHATAGGSYLIWADGGAEPLDPTEIRLRCQEDGVAALLRLQSRAIVDLQGEIVALREVVAESREAATAGQASLVAMAGDLATARARLDALEQTTDASLNRVRALARHLGADDTLVQWEKRQLRTLMATALDLAQRRGRKKGDAEDVMRQVKTTWSKVYDWVNDEVVEQLQREAQDLVERSVAGDEEAVDDDDDR